MRIEHQPKKQDDLKETSWWRRRWGIVLLTVLTVGSLVVLGYQFWTNPQEVPQAAPPTEHSKATEEIRTTETGPKSNASSTDPTHTPSKKKQETKAVRLEKVNDTQELDANGYADYEAMDRPTVEEIQDAQQHVDELQDLYVGSIEIPSIGLQMNILEGTTYERMLYAATTILPQSRMGHGNYALASHNMGVEGQMFTSLYQVKKGDRITLKDQTGKQYVYQTTKVQVVNYKDTSCLETPNDQAIVTLVTCESIEDTTNRVVVQGRLIE